MQHGGFRDDLQIISSKFSKKVGRNTYISDEYDQDIQGFLTEREVSI